MTNNLVIFASGGGSNFKSIFINTLKNNIQNSQVTLLISNNPKSNAVKYADSQNIDTFIINKNRYPDRVNYMKALINKLNKYNPTLIILAGYMKLIPKEVVRAFKNKIINIHPGKLPEFGGKGFYGINVHRAVIDSGAKSTVVTIHYVNEEYDKGMIIHEEIIDIMDDDTPESLSERVLKYEHSVYSNVIDKIINEKGTYEEKSIN